MAAGHKLLEPPEGEPRADVAPNIIGNDDVKEIILSALCFFHRNNVINTSVPKLLIAKSGTGKSEFFEGVKETFQTSADIFPIDAIDSLQMNKGGKGRSVARVTLPEICLFDDIYKWNGNYIKMVLIPIFNATKNCSRLEHDYIIDKTDQNTLPIGSLIPSWREYIGNDNKGKEKALMLEQIMRRCLLLNLDEDMDLEKYIDLCGSQIFANVPSIHNYDVEKNHNQVQFVVNKAQSLRHCSVYPFVCDDNLWPEEARNRINATAKHIKFRDEVSYENNFTINVKRLSYGMALRYGRQKACLEDVNRVCDILENHARTLHLFGELIPILD